MFIMLTGNRGNGGGFAGLSAPYCTEGVLVPPSYELNVLHILSFLLNGSSILSNNSLHSGKHMIYGTTAETNGLHS